MENIPDSAPGPPNTPEVQINAAILWGFQLYGGVHCPVLAVFADPHAPPPNTRADPKRAAMVSEDHIRTSEQVNAFRAGNPFATVIRIPNASHLVFQSNEAEVLRVMDTFVSGLQE
jgi:pimeloyl-ACP methyl ester carboxylesterase